MFLFYNPCSNLEMGAHYFNWEPEGHGGMPPGPPLNLMFGKWVLFKSAGVNGTSPATKRYRTNNGAVAGSCIESSVSARKGAPGGENRREVYIGGRLPVLSIFSSCKSSFRHGVTTVAVGYSYIHLECPLSV